MKSQLDFEWFAINCLQEDGFLIIWHPNCVAYFWAYKYWVLSKPNRMRISGYFGNQCSCAVFEYLHWKVFCREKGYVLKKKSSRKYILKTIWYDSGISFNLAKIFWYFLFFSKYLDFFAILKSIPNEKKYNIKIQIFNFKKIEL